MSHYPTIIVMVELFGKGGFVLTNAFGTADSGIDGPRLPPEPINRVAVLVPAKINFSIYCSSCLGHLGHVKGCIRSQSQKALNLHY